MDRKEPNMEGKEREMDDEAGSEEGNEQRQRVWVGEEKIQIVGV